MVVEGKIVFSKANSPRFTFRSSRSPYLQVSSATHYAVLRKSVTFEASMLAKVRLRLRKKNWDSFPQAMSFKGIVA